MKRLKDVNKKEINKVIIYTRRVLPPPAASSSSAAFILLYGIYAKTPPYPDASPNPSHGNDKNLTTGQHEGPCNDIKES